MKGYWMEIQVFKKIIMNSRINFMSSQIIRYSLTNRNRKNYFNFDFVSISIVLINYIIFMLCYYCLQG